MQVIDKIKILQEKLYSYDYVEIILAALLKGELPHIDFNGRCQFGLNSSDEFCKFFLCCNNILGLNDTTPNFKHVDDDYIMSLIYCSFCSDHGRDFTTETESPAIQATIFFFHLCSDRAFVVRIDKAIINSISKKVLQIIEQRVQNGKMSPSLSFTLNRFLAANIGNLDMEMMVDLLVTAFMKNTITIDDIGKLLV